MKTHEFVTFITFITFLTFITETLMTGKINEAKACKATS